LRNLVSARDRLLKNSYLMLEQLRTLDRCRFGDGPLTRLNAQEMAVVEKGLKAVMGMQ
jgi:mRNA interferase MazF